MRTRQRGDCSAEATGGIAAGQVGSSRERVSSGGSGSRSAEIARRKKRNDCKPESAAVSVDHVSARNRNLEPFRSFFDRCIASDVALIVVAIIRFICESRSTGVCSEAGAERFLFGEAREVVGLVE